jgi:hypothetical protein
MLLEQSFYSAVPDSYCRVTSYAEWAESADQLPGYEYLKRMIQFLQWQHRQQGRARPRWTLKAPHHLHYMRELFSVFPDATVIQTHRDPAESIASICSLSQHLLAMGTDRPDARWVGEHWGSKWARALDRAIAFRDAGGEARFLDVWFLDSVRDPVGTVRRVYEQLGRELSAGTAEKMKQWAADNAREKRAGHAYALEDYGLSESWIAERFAAYRERYILPHEPREPQNAAS